MMMSFCRSTNAQYSFLGDLAHVDVLSHPSHQTPDHVHDEQPTTTTTTTTQSQYPSSGLIFAPEKETNVDVIKTIPQPKKDLEGIRFAIADDTPHGLSSTCTESLGFESSNEDMAIEELGGQRGDYSERTRGRKRSTASEIRFPPPLTSLNENGQPSFVLKPVRKDGRLELTEVPINRPEILCASRENGRLMMHLVKKVDDEEATEEEEEEEEEQLQQEEERGLVLMGVEGEENLREEEGRGGRDDGEVGWWAFPAAAGEGVRPCHEMVKRRTESGHHYVMWVQQQHKHRPYHYVTTR